MIRLRTGIMLCVLGACSTPTRTPAPSNGQSHDVHEGSIAEGLDCANCHTTDGWAIGDGGSGEEGEGGFDHRETGFPLTGGHQSVACVDCHQPNESLHRTCVSCHEDVHQGRMSRQCDSCHSAQSFTVTDAIALHRSTLLPLTGMHVLATCTECHQRQGDSWVRNAPSDCFSCHSVDYVSPATHPSHIGAEGGQPFPRDCSECHRAMGWSPALVSLDVLPGITGLRAPVDHDLIFPIGHGPHQGAACTSCHQIPQAPQIVQCTTCHEHSEIRIRLDHPGLSIHTDGPGCLSCHPTGSPL